MSGVEGEGNAGTLTVDTGTSIKVYILGPAAPATGDFIVCRSVDYRWVSDKTAPAANCGTAPCTIPAGNLTATIQYINDSGGTSTATLTLVPDPTQSNQPDLTTNLADFTVSGSTQHFFAVYGFLVNPNKVTFNHAYGHTSGGYSFNTVSGCFFSFTCSPFHVVYQPNAGTPGYRVTSIVVTP